MWDRVETSSEVVGSSAMRSLGFFARAMAIMIRWHWPPESWCGRLSRREASAESWTCSRSCRISWLEG